MKKIISFLLATTLIFALSVPAMSASDAFLADKTVYFDTDRIEDNLEVGTKVTWQHFTADSGWTVPTGFSSVYNGGMAYTLKEDAVKGKYIETSTTRNYSRFYNTSPMDCVAGDRYVIEFSVKHNNGTNDKIDFSGIGDQTTISGDFQYGKTDGVYVLKRRGKGGETIKNDFVVGEWYHIVAEITPGQTSGTIQFYVNGVAAGTTYSSTVYTIENFQSSWKNMQIDIDGTIDVDDIRMYKLTSAYDPATAGDVASVSSSTLSVESNKIKYAGKMTLAGIRQALTASSNATVKFLTSENVEIVDETTLPTTGMKVRVRSASGSMSKHYILEEEQLVSSSTYTVTNGVISGIENNTSVATFLDSLISNASLSVVDSSGTPAEAEDIIAMGMKLVATQESGVKRAEYDINCANLVFIAPQNYTVVKSTTQELEVSFNGTGTVDFYVNGNVYETTTAAPHKITVQHERIGNYTVYAKVTFAGGAEMETNRITYTYALNEKPTVAISGVENGNELGINDTLSITVTATDDGTITETALYVDGIKQSGTSPYTVGPLSLGSHEIYAVAKDNENATNRTQSYRVQVVQRQTVSVVYDDFTTSSHWSGGEIVELGDADASRGSVYRFASDGVGELNFTGDASLIPVAGYVEMDIRHSDPSINSRIFLAQKSSVRAWDETIKIDDGKLGTADINANEWYSLKIYWNAQTKEIKGWVKDNVSGEWVLAKESNNMDSDGALAGIKMHFGYNDPPAGNYTFDIDNFKMYYIQETTYIKNVEYLDAGGANVFSNNEANADLKTVKLSFNNEISAPTVTTDNIKVYANDVLQTGYDVVADGKVVNITFSGDIKTLSDYRINYTGLKDGYEEAVESGVLTFRTSAAEYDCLEWTVKKSNETLQSLNTIAKGDVLTLTAKLTNTSSQTKNSTLVFAVYSGNILVGSSFTSVSLGSNQTIPFTSLPLTVSDDANGDLKAFGYVWDTTAARNIEIQRFTMSN